MSAALTTNVDQRLLRTTKFPPEFNVKVDRNKINVHLIKSWAHTEIAKILNNDDDVVAELVSNILEESRYPNIKELQISLTGFLDKDAPSFCQKLWKLCLSAQENSQGIPKELIEAKKAELTQEKAEKEKAREEAAKREEADRQRDRELARIRDRERSERDRGRGGRGGRDFDRRPPRDSRSPPRRRRDDDDFRRARPRVDTYKPSGTGRRRRSPSRDRSSSRSRSRSPPPRRARRNSSASRSPSPIRRRRRSTSSERSSSPRDRYQRDRNGRRGGDHGRTRSRSPLRKRRSPSRRRDHRRISGRSRSPPSKRTRRGSPSPRDRSMSGSASSNMSPATRKRAAKALAPDDLMATDRRKEHPERLRLSREPSPGITSRSQTPITNMQGETNHSSKTLAGAEDEENFRFKGAALRQNLPVPSRGAATAAAGRPIQQHRANVLREKLLKEQLMARFAAERAKQEGAGEGASQK